MRVDWIGSILLTTSLISLLFGVTSGGVLHSWNSASVITPIIAGVLGTAGFLFYEGKYAVEPMIPLRIFASRTAGAGFLSSFMLGFVLWAMQYYLILYVSKYFMNQFWMCLTNKSRVSCHSKTFIIRFGSVNPTWLDFCSRYRFRRRTHYLKATEIQNHELYSLVDSHYWIFLNDPIENRFS